MKKRNTLTPVLLLLFTVSLILTLTSCEEGMSKEERINNFVSDLNTSSRSNIADNFTAAGKIGAAPNVFDDPSPYFGQANQPYSFSQTGSSGDTIIGNLNSNAVRFEMDVSDLGGLGGGEDWKINRITTSGGTTLAGAP